MASAGPSARGRGSRLTEAYWRDEAVPELRDALRLDRARAGRDDAGRRAGRAPGTRSGRGSVACWAIHFYAIRGPYQVLEDLADLYESVVEERRAGRGARS